MRRAARILIPLLGAAWLGGCSSPTSSSPTFSITITASPDPAVATASKGVQYKITNPDNTVSYYDYQYWVHFTLHIQENNGMALDITSINLTAQQAAGGIVVTPSGGDQIYFKYNSTALTNHINAKGSADVGFDVWYTLPSGGKEALMSVAFGFQYTDSSGNVTTYSQTGNAKVAP
ncbi:MAG TPA: hypothetical protein VMX54_05755 [Vicinamibacteria bacterium]|nr:hypothetical protein [Vicinamibacteria bacterium]